MNMNYNEACMQDMSAMRCFYFLQAYADILSESYT